MSLNLQLRETSLASWCCPSLTNAQPCIVRAAMTRSRWSLLAKGGRPSLASPCPQHSTRMRTAHSCALLRSALLLSALSCALLRFALLLSTPLLSAPLPSALFLRTEISRPSLRRPQQLVPVPPSSSRADSEGGGAAYSAAYLYYMLYGVYAFKARLCLPECACMSMYAQAIKT